MADSTHDHPSAERAAWYAEGLAFECSRCGNCCTGEPGSVRVSEAEARALAASEGLTLAQFDALRTRPESSRPMSRSPQRFLREREDGACIYWDAGRGCTVYALRPRQCRTFPFWRGIVASPAHWARAAEACPGIGQGARHSSDDIQAALANDGTSGWIPPLDDLRQE
ncbi:MAG: YkgJ family cysteine cluster protein [Planctomycetota bacterium]